MASQIPRLALRQVEPNVTRGADSPGDLRVVDLKKELKTLGLSHNGLKKDLAARLRLARAQTADSPDAISPVDEPVVSQAAESRAPSTEEAESAFTPTAFRTVSKVFKRSTMTTRTPPQEETIDENDSGSPATACPPAPPATLATPSEQILAAPMASVPVAFPLTPDVVAVFEAQAHSCIGAAPPPSPGAVESAVPASAQGRSESGCGWAGWLLGAAFLLFGAGTTMVACGLVALPPALEELLPPAVTDTFAMLSDTTGQDGLADSNFWSRLKQSAGSVPAGAQLWLADAAAPAAAAASLAAQAYVQAGFASAQLAATQAWSEALSLTANLSAYGGHVQACVLQNQELQEGGLELQVLELQAVVASLKEQLAGC